MRSKRSAPDRETKRSAVSAVAIVALVCGLHVSAATADSALHGVGGRRAPPAATVDVSTDITVTVSPNAVMLSVASTPLYASDVTAAYAVCAQTACTGVGIKGTPQGDDWIVFSGVPPCTNFAWSIAGSAEGFSYSGTGSFTSQGQLTTLQTAVIGVSATADGALLDLSKTPFLASDVTDLHVICDVDQCDTEADAAVKSATQMGFAGLPPRTRFFWTLAASKAHGCQLYTAEGHFTTGSTGVRTSTDVSTSVVVAPDATFAAFDVSATPIVPADVNVLRATCTGKGCVNAIWNADLGGSDLMLWDLLPGVRYSWRLEAQVGNTDGYYAAGTFVTKFDLSAGVTFTTTATTATANLQLTGLTVAAVSELHVVCDSDTCGDDEADAVPSGAWTMLLSGLRPRSSYFWTLTAANRTALFSGSGHLDTKDIVRPSAVPTRTAAPTRTAVPTRTAKPSPSKSRTPSKRPSPTKKPAPKLAAAGQHSRRL